MEQLNRIELRGNVGYVRLSRVGEDSQVVNFSVATTYVYKGRNGEAVMETTWHSVVMWNLKNMPDIDRLMKGCPVSVTGRVRANCYRSADGTDKTVYEVQASKVELLEEQLTMQAGF